MRFILAFIIFGLVPLQAGAGDKVLVLNEQQQAALRVILDSAIHAQGLTTVARNAFVFSDMLDAAGPPLAAPQPRDPSKEPSQ